MNRDRIKPRAGETVWVVPIRYWELENKPERVDVVTDGDGSGALYGFHHGHGHNVYTATPWYFKEAHTRKAQELMAALYELSLEDDAEQLTDRFFPQREATHG